MTRARRIPRPLVAAAILVAACDDPKTFLPDSQAGGPAGVIQGALTYSGPPPCTVGGRVVGAAALFAFDTRLLPPPDGLGTTAASFAAVTGEALFAGVRDALVFQADGSRWCPDAKATPVTVTAPWTLGPLPAGTYQVRGFYDRDGNFDPAFTIANLPTKGDVGGGAIENPSEVLAGKPPRYREIGLGTANADGSRSMPDTGARVDGVAVTLGLTMEAERPIFHVAEVFDGAGGIKDVATFVLPSDYALATFDPKKVPETEKSFVRLHLAAGVASSEAAAAAASPFGFPTKSPTFLVTRQDVNGDGVLDAKDHIPDSTLIPSLFPLSILSKLADGTSSAQAAPVVLLEGLTIADSLLKTALSSPSVHDDKGELFVALRPSVVCIDPLDASKHAVLVVTHEKDKAGNPIITDAKALTAALGAQLGRTVDLVYGCLPEGRYGVNLVYGTGQAWTTPNEAGVCAPSEAPSGGGSICGTRPRLASQAAALTIGAPEDAAYCKAHPAPKACGD